MADECGRMSEELAAARELDLARAVGQETEVTDAHEAVGHDMEQEAADELVGVEGYHLDAIAVGVVLPARLAPRCDVGVVADVRPIARARGRPCAISEANSSATSQGSERAPGVPALEGTRTREPEDADNYQRWLHQADGGASMAVFHVSMAAEPSVDTPKSALHNGRFSSVDWGVLTLIACANLR